MHQQLPSSTLNDRDLTYTQTYFDSGPSNPPTHTRKHYFQPIHPKVQQVMADAEQAYLLTRNEQLQAREFMQTIEYKRWVQMKAEEMKREEMREQQRQYVKQVMGGGEEVESGERKLLWSGGSDKGFNNADSFMRQDQHPLLYDYSMVNEAPYNKRAHN